VLNRLRPLPLTGAGAAATGLALLLGLVAVRSANSWLLLICCGVLAPVLLAQVYRPDLRSPAVRVIGPARSAVGATVTHLVEVANAGRRRTPPLVIHHRVGGFDQAVLLVPPLDPGARVEITVERVARARCAPATEEVLLSTTAPFGLATQRHRAAVRDSRPVAVHPAPAPPLDLTATLTSRALSAVGAAPARTGDEIQGLREWQRGDSRRQVHWRATARAGRLTVTSWQETSAVRLACVLVDDDEPWLARAAWTAVAVTAAGGTVRLAAPGAPTLRTRDADAVLDWCAAVVVAGDPQPVLRQARDWAGADGLVLHR
jgi:uncharacterized protein (DUF58 family)